MPPIPVECVEYPVVKRSRTRLNFGDSSKETSTQTSGLFTDMFSNDMKLIENEIKPRTFVNRKRSSEALDMTPKCKKMRCQFYTSTPKPVLTESTVTNMSPISSIINAVERLSTKTDLIADATRENILPTITGKHSDLSSISPETMSAILDGHYDNKMEARTIIDCRYPYEFEGGHIEGAINLYTKPMIEQYLKDNISSKTHVLIFHCEFSSERGPKMYRFLRSLDREMNKDNYPKLHFPEIYLLEGGYKAFFYEHKEQCQPQTYKPMLHKDHKDDLRHFRVKSKSWAAGDKPRHRAVNGAGLRLRF